MNHLETYLTHLHDARATGEAVKETSFYPAIAALFNSFGAELKPKVKCVINIKNRGAGIPDGGLFTAEQLRTNDAEAVANVKGFNGQRPARGVIEVKGTREDVRRIAAGEQVEKYLRHYGLVLVTNLREFLIVERDANGKARTLEGYALASDEKEFWATSPRALAAEHEERFAEYLKRVMLTAAPLDDPESLAWFLASYARDAKVRIEQAELPSLQSVRKALEDALGLQFEGERGEAFFRSTLIQTLFYGVFSAWVLWCKSDEGRNRANKFRWKEAAYSLHVPVIRTLFEQMVTPSNVRGLGLEDVLTWTADALNRVERESFFKRFEEEHAVQYFYEPFLEAFDPELRKSLGVWYTPQEIVAYMVERVDRVLREELNLPRGLADERVYVLDPCCGTGAYLVEVLKRIKRTVDEEGADALSANDLKDACLNRVFGFEILPAPFVVAHMQLGLVLQQAGVPLSDEVRADGSGERVGVYLTNALTGWEPPKEPKSKLPFPELEQERDAAEQVKQTKQILVILGNPPYNAFAGTSAVEEGGLVDAYKAGLVKEWGIKKFNLDDLYVRFFRLAERRIAEKTGEGVVCFISNLSYLSDPSFVVMRQRFLQEFDRMWFDSLNGDSRETGKLTPEGKPDPSVFSTQYNCEGIRVGTTIGLMVRKAKRDDAPTVRLRQFWGVTKREALTAGLAAEDFDAQYAAPAPDKTNRHSFLESRVSAQYLSWASLVDLTGEPKMNGLLEMRKGALRSFDKATLEKRMRAYYDPLVSWEELKSLKTGLTEDAARFDAKKTRDKVLAAEAFNPQRIVSYTLRPFDTVWCYHTPVRPLWNEPRPRYAAQLRRGNSFLVSRPYAPRDPEGSPLFLVTGFVDYNFFPPASVFPLQLHAKSVEMIDKQQSTFFAESETTETSPTANLSDFAREYLRSLGITDPDADAETASLIWMHALAIGYSPLYRSENRDGIRADFPRIPLPATLERLRASAALGGQVAALLDTETHVAGVTSGAVRPELASIGVLRHTSGGNLNPAAGDLELRAGWGHKGSGGVTMPGKGKTRIRDYTQAERAAASAHPGAQTLDVYLNDVAFWSCVPARVWEYTIGGYQVIKKWLSYRELENLGRSLTGEEAREVTRIARRIVALLLLEDDLNQNYTNSKAKS